MPVAGEKMLPRDIAELCHQHGWRDLDLVYAVAVCLAESGGYTRAWNDNYQADGTTIKSRDVGLFQINLAGAQVGTPAEEALYDIETNAGRAYAMFLQRGWTPWVAWDKGVAQDPDWWRWDPVQNRWEQPKRYLHQALRGVSNWNGIRLFIDSPPEGLFRFTRIPSEPTGPPQ